MSTFSKKRKFFELSEVDLCDTTSPQLSEENSHDCKETCTSSKLAKLPSKRLKFNDNIEVLLFEKDDGETPLWVSESKMKALELRD